MSIPHETYRSTAVIPLLVHSRPAHTSALSCCPEQQPSGVDQAVLPLSALACCDDTAGCCDDLAGCCCDCGPYDLISSC